MRAAAHGRRLLLLLQPPAASDQAPPAGCERPKPPAPGRERGPKVRRRGMGGLLCQSRMTTAYDSMTTAGTNLYDGQELGLLAWLHFK
jgi:hypothetical protein